MCRGEQLRLQCVVESQLAAPIWWARAIFKNGTHEKLLTLHEFNQPAEEGLWKHSSSSQEIAAPANSSDREPRRLYDIEVRD